MFFRPLFIYFLADCLPWFALGMSSPMKLNLGSHKWSGLEAFSTSYQNSFNLGLNQYWGFNHEDAISHFEGCIKEIPDYILPYIFIALSLSPNFNNDVGLDVKLALKKLEEGEKNIGEWNGDLERRFAKAAKLRALDEVFFNFLFFFVSL